MAHGKPRDRSARRLVLLSSVVFLGFGAAYLLFPAQLARYFGIQLTTASALADLRAMYGGVPLALGAVLVQALRDPRWLAPSLAMIMASLAGAAAARIYSIAVSGVPDALVLTFLVAELLGFRWALIEHRAHARQLRAALRRDSEQPTQSLAEVQGGIAQP